MSDRQRPERRYWLDDPRNVDRVAYTLYAVCGVFFLADLLYVKHPHFGFEHWFGFHAGYGFVACVSLVLAAKLLRRVVKRDEDYYDATEDDHEPDDEQGSHVR